jgi:hypothetical protein
MRDYRPFFTLPHQLAQCPFLLFKSKENRVLVSVGHLVDRKDTTIVIDHLLRAADQEGSDFDASVRGPYARLAAR